MNNRAKVREEQAAVEAAKVWRQVRWILAGIFAALLVAGLFLTGILPLRKKLTPTDLAVFGQYDAIRHALANEQLDEAQRAAESLAAIADAKPIYTEAAKSVARSDSLSAAREHFVPLSEAIVALVSGRPGYLSCTARCRAARSHARTVRWNTTARGFKPHARLRIPTWA